MYNFLISVLKVQFLCYGSNWGNTKKDRKTKKTHFRFVPYAEWHSYGISIHYIVVIDHVSGCNMYSIDITVVYALLHAAKIMFQIKSFIMLPKLCASE